ALTAFAMIGYLKSYHPTLPIAAGGGLITSWLSSPEGTNHGIRRQGSAHLPSSKRLQGAGDARHHPAMCTGVHEQADNTADSVPCDRLRPEWRNPFNKLIDHLVAGPGEIPLLKISGWQKDHLESEKICPDFTGLPLTDYLAPGLILPYAASTGCYWRKCSFCPEKAETNPYRALPAELVSGQLAKLTAAAEPSLIHFLDNAISPALMHALIANPPGPDWYSFARAEPELTDPDFCLALRRSGCVMLKLGLESGDQGVLDEMDKGIDLGMVAKTLANLEKAGIATYVYLLFGTPTESLPEARRTLEFTVKHASAITFLNLAIFNMPRFAPDAASLAKTAFYEGDLSLYTDFEHPRAWNRREIRRFLDREFKRHPAIAPIIRRDPPFFTSNHAPFLIPASSKTLGNSHL
ncbi:MAG: radical SAM protein, partial [Desulfurivibrionaceae bacterium]